MNLGGSTKGFEYACFNLGSIQVCLKYMSLLLLLLPLLLSDLGLHLRPEVVDHLLLVLLVHVEEGGGRVVSGPEQRTFVGWKISSLSGEI